jgi:hypothetical protein
MYFLYLNDMRSSNIETLTPVAKGSSVEALKAYVESEKVPYYEDGRFGKGFRQGGRLEWFNYPSASFEHQHYRHDPHIHLPFVG